MPFGMETLHNMVAIVMENEQSRAFLLLQSAKKELAFQFKQEDTCSFLSETFDNYLLIVNNLPLYIFVVME